MSEEVLKFRMIKRSKELEKKRIRTLEEVESIYLINNFYKYLIKQKGMYTNIKMSYSEGEYVIVEYLNLKKNSLTAYKIEWEEVGKCKTIEELNKELNKKKRNADYYALKHINLEEKNIFRFIQNFDLQEVLNLDLIDGVLEDNCDFGVMLEDIIEANCYDDELIIYTMNELITINSEYITVEEKEYY